MRSPGKYPLLFAVVMLPFFAVAQLLGNGGFEGSYTGVATGWTQITYGSPAFPNVQYAKETVNVHSGSAAQKITIASLGDGATLLQQPFDFPAGKIYEGTVWLRSDDTVKVVFMYQERVPYYYVPAVVVREIGPSWQQLKIKGGYGRNITNDQSAIQGRFVIQPLGPGVLYADEAVLRDITDSVLNAPVVSTDAVPAAYFGMHINKLGVHQTYPPTQPGMIRLWNTGTEWADIEPYSGALLDSLNWVYDPNNNYGFGFRLDYYVNFIRAHDSTAGIIYTMGQTPSWAAASTAAPPASLAAWQDYVSIIGNRYKNKIRYWEPWNEVDFSSSWSGTDSQLISLAQAAYTTLKNIDNGNQVLTPNVAGAEKLAHYLFAGGGAYADIISCHQYPCRRPEEMIPELIGISDVAANYGLSAKPLWNTEGAVSIPAASSFAPDEDRAAVSRALILPWTFGIRNFNWYAWDIYYSSICDYARLSASLSPNQYDSLTAVGKAYLKTLLWLKGAVVKSRTVTGDSWTIALERPGGYKAWIVWNVTGSQSFNIPASWNIQQLRDLNGSVTPFPGVTIQADEKPVLLENSNLLSMEEPEALRHGLAYPNPFGTELFIRLPPQTAGPYTMTLRNALGQVVCRKYERSLPFSGLVKMETGGLAPGLYLLDICSDHYRETVKLVKK